VSYGNTFGLGKAHRQQAGIYRAAANDVCLHFINRLVDMTDGSKYLPEIGRRVSEGIIENFNRKAS
jgi:hypothetical protein